MLQVERREVCHQSLTKLFLPTRVCVCETQTLRGPAWRIKALFSRVAGHQQELDMQRLLAGLEIGGPYYHCLPYWRALHGGKECPLAPLHSRHIHPPPSHLLTHIPHILSLLACPSSSLTLISYFTPQKKRSICASAVKWAQWKPVDKHKKGVRGFGTSK